MTETKRDVIDLQGLLDKAKAAPINLIEREWYEIEGSPIVYPCGEDGYKEADEVLEKQFPGEGYKYVRQNKIRFKQAGRPMHAIISELVDKMRSFGITPQEGDFSHQHYEWQTADEQRAASRASALGRPLSQDEWRAQDERDRLRPIPLNYRWLAVYPVTGSSEGYYIHIDLMFQQSREKTPQFAAIRGMMDRIERLSYDEQNYESDKKLLAAAKTAFYEQDHSSRKLLALAKTWEWDNACACAAVAARLLGA